MARPSSASGSELSLLLSAFPIRALLLAVAASVLLVGCIGAGEEGGEGGEGDVLGQTATGVKGTMWADKTDSGGCEMPKSEYLVLHAVAIGDESAMGTLGAQNSNRMCGQVLRVNCGGTSVDAVVASTCNYGARNCGVDLIRMTWDEATGGSPPGIASCTAELTTTQLMAGTDMRCYFRPSAEQGTNEFHASVGVFNTGGRLPTSATLNGIAGTPNGASAYFDFSGNVGKHAGSTVPLAVTFADGSQHTVDYGDCATTAGAYIWGR